MCMNISMFCPLSPGSVLCFQPSLVDFYSLFAPTISAWTIRVATIDWVRIYAFPTKWVRRMRQQIKDFAHLFTLFPVAFDSQSLFVAIALSGSSSSGLDSKVIQIIFDWKIYYKWHMCFAHTRTNCKTTFAVSADNTGSRSICFIHLQTLFCAIV